MGVRGDRGLSHHSYDGKMDALGSSGGDDTEAGPGSELEWELRMLFENSDRSSSFNGGQ